MDDVIPLFLPKRYKEARMRISSFGIFDIEDVLVELRAINEFPTTISIYDRTFVLNSKDERQVLMSGLEIGWALSEEGKQ